MSMRSCGRLAVLACCVLLAPRLSAQKAPALPDLLKLATDYVSAYATKLDTVAAEEEFTQFDTNPAHGATPKRLTSSIVLLGQSDGSILGFRDVIAIDNVPVRPKDDRLAAMFASVTPASVTGAQDLTDQAVRLYYSSNLHALDRPTAALDLLRREKQQNYTFKVEGTKSINGVQTAVLGFKEKGKGHLMPNATAIGKYWVGINDGAIQQTELGFIADGINLHATVKFGNDPQLNVLVPTELVEQVDASSSTANMSDMGAASAGAAGAHESFEGRAFYSKYRRLSTPSK